VIRGLGIRLHGIFAIEVWYVSKLSRQHCAVMSQVVSHVKIKFPVFWRLFFAVVITLLVHNWN
jgi:hypothetical protein